MSEALQKERLKSLKARAEKKEDDRRKSNIETLAVHIDLGEQILSAKAENPKVFTNAWFQREIGISQPQNSRLCRIAKHKAQALALANEDPTFAIINNLVKVLPGVNEDPEEIEAEPPPDAKPARNSNDWHTPTIYLDAVREVLGTINLDPFSSIQANERVKAKRFFTVADDALSKSWRAKTVFMNPPYGNKKAQGTTATQAVGRFIDQLATHGFEAIVLMNLAYDTEWSRMLSSNCTLRCHTDHRIAFEDAGGKKISGNTKSQTFYYFGDKPDVFADVFEGFGEIVAKRERCING